MQYPSLIMHLFSAFIPDFCGCNSLSLAVNSGFVPGKQKDALSLSLRSFLPMRHGFRSCPHFVFQTCCNQLFSLWIIFGVSKNTRAGIGVCSFAFQRTGRTVHESCPLFPLWTLFSFPHYCGELEGMMRTRNWPTEKPRSWEKEWDLV